MSLLLSLPLLLPLAAVVVVVIVVVVVVSRSRTPRALGAPGTPGYPPVVAGGQWNAHVRRDGHLDALAGFGVLTLAGGVLSFTPEGAGQPEWSGAAVSFGIRLNSAIAANDVVLDSASTGRLRVTVSYERINRFSRNDFKALREWRTSAGFVDAMRAAGAVPMG